MKSSGDTLLAGHIGSLVGYNHNRIHPSRSAPLSAVKNIATGDNLPLIAARTAISQQNQRNSWFCLKSWDAVTIPPILNYICNSNVYLLEARETNAQEQWSAHAVYRTPMPSFPTTNNCPLEKPVSARILFSVAH